MLISLACSVCGHEFMRRSDRIASYSTCSTKCRTSLDFTKSRFMRSVSVATSGCWEWIASRSTGGYGKFRFGGQTGLAHRYSYLSHKGEIPAGLQIDHLCRNRCCVNPAHLEAVTCGENLLRGDTFQAKNVAKTHCPQGHAYSVENTYRSPDGRRRCIACRRKSDMHPVAVERRRAYKIKLKSYVPDANEVAA